MWNWNSNLKWSLTFGLPCVSCHVRRDQPFHARHVQVWGHAKCKKSWLDTNFGYSFTYSYFFITLWYFRYFSILEKVARTLEIPQTHREPKYKKYSFYYLPAKIQHFCLPGSGQKSFKVCLFLDRSCAIFNWLKFIFICM